MSGVSFEQAVLKGCPGDGGLFVPETYPTLSREQLRAWSPLTYPQLVEKVLKLFIDEVEMSDQEIKGVGCFSDHLIHYITHTHARTHARTHAHACTHTRTPLSLTPLKQTNKQKNNNNNNNNTHTHTHRCDEGVLLQI